MMIEVGSGPAVFRCRHASLEATVVWRVNGSSVGQFPDILSNTVTDDSGTKVYTLIIPARSEYSGIEVICVAFFFDTLPESTPPVMLIITGLMLPYYMLQS